MSEIIVTPERMGYKRPSEEITLWLRDECVGLDKLLAALRDDDKIDEFLSKIEAAGYFTVTSRVRAHPVDIGQVATRRVKFVFNRTTKSWDQVVTSNLPCLQAKNIAIKAMIEWLSDEFYECYTEGVETVRTFSLCKAWLIESLVEAGVL